MEKYISNLITRFIFCNDACEEQNLQVTKLSVWLTLPNYLPPGIGSIKLQFAEGLLCAIDKIEDQLN